MDIEERAEKWAKEYDQNKSFPESSQDRIKDLIDAYLAGSQDNNRRERKRNMYDLEIITMNDEHYVMYFKSTEERYHFIDGELGRYLSNYRFEEDS